MKRGRNQRRRQGVNPNRALDSNGPDVRIRGTANQIYDKYQALARDAASAGDRIKAESYLQHAEHYFRLIRSMQAAQQPQATADGEGEQPSVENSDEPREARRQQRGRRNGAAAANAEPANEQPVIDAPAETPPETPVETSADAATPAVEDDGAAKETAEAESAEKPVEEKKPRRRRAPRRTTKRAADAEASPEKKEEAAAAAE